jgi:LmbE family N-acetylglucosaminyl deacetylase
MKECIVVFAAHTADAELGAGGTMAKFVRHGYRVVVVIVTTSVSEPVVKPMLDGQDSDSLTPRELAALREQEAYESAQVIGHELEFLRLNERFFTYQGKRYYVDFREEPLPVELPGTGWFGAPSPDAQTFVRKAQEIMLREEPEFILTHSVTDSCYEHYLVINTLATAYRSVLGREGKSIGKLLAWETDQDKRTFQIPITGIEDITEFRGIKHEALLKHASRVDKSMLDLATARETHWGRTLRGLTSIDPRQAFGEAFTRQCMKIGIAYA